MDIDYVFQNVANKVEVYTELRKKLKLGDEDIAVVGDDLNDLEIMKIAKYSFTVADGLQELKNIAKYVSIYDGGKGAVRDIIQFCIKEKIINFEEND
ncbi:HAD hydrolase family protein [Robertmurraya massiliosenegalensis]|uniref:HAD hydrolase family protein n=1 Tax=Robertmurraya massiliosenegalensis TaxID=1287657 RepID=UPI0002EE8FF5|nr:HAD hydrolase family protein [Robertmurraya massiliosenegalensis]